MAKSVTFTIAGLLVIMSGPFLSAMPKLALCAVSESQTR